MKTIDRSYEIDDLSDLCALALSFTPGKLAARATYKYNRMVGDLDLYKEAVLLGDLETAQLAYDDAILDLGEFLRITDVDYDDRSSLEVVLCKVIPDVFNPEWQF